MTTLLGIDPGLASTGYGVIAVDGNRIRHLAHGVITTSSSDTTGLRLEQIFSELESLLLRYKPVEAGVESLYFSKNITSAIPVAHARGVVLLALAQAGVDAHEYTPQAIKSAIVGEGRADKRQIIEFVRVLLNLPEAPGPDHAADALAAAICHNNNRSYISLKQAAVKKASL